MLTSQRSMEQQLLGAAIKGDTETVKLLVNLKSEIINYQSTTGYNALMLAAQYGHLETVQFLLSRNAKTDYLSGGVRNRRSPALMLAVEKGYFAIVRELLDHGAPIDQQNQYGSTALMWASYLGSKEIVRLLLDRGADIDHVNEDGTTALMNAVSAGHEEIVQMIREESEKRKKYEERGDRIKLCFLGKQPDKEKNLAPSSQDALSTFSTEAKDSVFRKIHGC